MHKSKIPGTVASSAVPNKSAHLPDKRPTPSGVRKQGQKRDIPKEEMNPTKGHFKVSEVNAFLRTNKENSDIIHTHNETSTRMTTSVKTPKPIRPERSSQKVKYTTNHKAIKEKSAENSVQTQYKIVTRAMYTSKRASTGITSKIGHSMTAMKTLKLQNKSLDQTVADSPSARHECTLDTETITAHNIVSFESNPLNFKAVRNTLNQEANDRLSFEASYNEKIRGREHLIEMLQNKRANEMRDQKIKYPSRRDYKCDNIKLTSEKKHLTYNENSKTISIQDTYKERHTQELETKIENGDTGYACASSLRESESKIGDAKFETRQQSMPTKKVSDLKGVECLHIEDLDIALQHESYATIRSTLDPRVSKRVKKEISDTKSNEPNCDVIEKGTRDTDEAHEIRVGSLIHARRINDTDVPVLSTLPERAWAEIDKCLSTITPTEFKRNIPLKSMVSSGTKPKLFLANKCVPSRMREHSFDTKETHPNHKNLTANECIDIGHTESNTTDGVNKERRYRELSRSMCNREEGDDDIPPCNFRDIPVSPTQDEIISIVSPFLRKNKIQGNYNDVEHYLDVQFRLLREDFVGSFRAGITQYVQAINGKSRKRKIGVHIYSDVKVIGPDVTDKGACFKMKIQMTPRLKHIISQSGKRLIFGTLVALSDDNFKTVMFATVIDNDKLDRGIFKVAITSCGRLSVDISGRSYTMAESSAYFEPYKHVLSGLQRLNDANFAFQKNIIHCEASCNPPAYMTNQTKFDLTPLIKGDFKIVHEKKLRVDYRNKSSVPSQATLHMVTVLDKKTWPSKEALHLDDSQMKALQNALCREFAIIQGPPGTGKTFIGLQIMKVLLNNNIQWNSKLHSPILIVCFTNHALDQFLERLTDFYDGDIVRVGSRSKCSALENMTLKKYKQQTKDLKGNIFQMTKDRRRKHGELEIQQRKLKGLYMTKEACGCTILREGHFSNIIEKHLYKSLVIGKRTKDDAESVSESRIAEWLQIKTIENNCRAQLCFSGSRNRATKGRRRDPDYLHFIKNKNNNHFQQIRKKLSGYTSYMKKEHEIQHELAEIRKNMSIVRNELENIHSLDEHNDDLRKAEDLTKKICSLQTQFEEKKMQLQEELDFHMQFENQIKRKIAMGDVMTKQEASVKADVWLLDINERWKLYRCFRKYFLEDLQDKIDDCQETVKDKADQYEHAQINEERAILQRASIIGMTTTCAARYSETLRYIKPKIVIVEEAAEVLEAHVITALNKNCEHLILIGDHKQLQPNPALYELELHYNLNISLFERMVMNGIQHDCLQLQHRMRPEIADIMRHIYYNLIDNVNVKQYENIRGVSKNVMFIRHEIPETHDNDRQSYSNTFEAEYVTKLTNYFLLQGYSGKQITVLATYNSQLIELKNHMKAKAFSEVTITVVDNYQGEENDIVILSLVRSNHEKKIGFMKKENRICVALSRSKMGLYVVGNVNHLSKYSSLWKTITNDMAQKGFCGDGLELRCQNHPNDSPIVAKLAKDFDLAPLGGCSKMCNTHLACGHECPQVCHIIDNTHELFQCKEPCIRQPCTMNHVCTGKCYESPCPPCRQIVERKLQICGHFQNIACYIDPENVKCMFRPCSFLLPCGHKCENACGESHTINCLNPCGFRLKCGHLCSGTCTSCIQGRFHEACKYKCDKLLVCDHLASTSCFLSQPCTQSCKNSCPHSMCKRLCGIPCVPCKKNCKWKCKHFKCTLKCSEPCNRPPCNSACFKKLKCGHQCIGLCGEPCPNKCRVCDETEIKGLLSESKGISDARFVHLSNCDHLVEYSALDSYMNSIGNMHGELRLKGCPICGTPIRNCVRYGNITKARLNDIETVKTKIIGGSITALKSLLKRKRDLLMKEISPQRKNEPFMSAFGRMEDRLKTFENNPDKILTKTILETIQKQLKVIKAFQEYYQIDSNKMAFFDHTVAKISEERDAFTEQEVDDANKELNRARCYVNFVHFGGQTEDSKLENIIFMMGKLSQNQNKEMHYRINNLMKLLRRRRPHVNQAHIATASTLNDGRWFKCFKGHVFSRPARSTGDEDSWLKCPECKENASNELTASSGTPH
ncbi:NFX1-type zinc finger-containing protein 1-like [Dreissena polymorpha]|uniref:NF-X1-type domain-containing protein n=1 Tax=Dreissena polymorpha TaxID=45954 RepID=A0A9D4GA92_DREPO|nr:NFX1-type zinc finger-containing protein 1-like [Dreissena polymorpha]KAH3813248.1 hypothetical protein DPMN_141700 [Dreissena polymorpha]